jgi:nucleotide-binding universal stress UspA family protein
MIKSVLIPVDFTEESRLLTSFASGLGALGVQRAVLGHCVECSGMEGPVIVASADRARDKLRGVAADLAAAGIETEVRVVTGGTAQAMIALASEVGVDAIVSGTHGKTVLDRLIGGSVSEDLLANADRPSLFCRFRLLRNAANPADLARGFGRALVLPTDFSEPSERALNVVTELGKGAVSMLYVLHVIDGSLAEDARRAALEDAEVELARIIETATRNGIAARRVIRYGEPGREVLRELDERRASGVITGSRGRGAWTNAVLGSVSLTLLRQASCPVLVVP